MTIVDAVKEVLSKEQAPMTCEAIYAKIIERNLYVFPAKKPIAVVSWEIRRHCKNLEFATSSPNRVFELTGYDNKKALYYVCSDKKNSMNPLNVCLSHIRHRILIRRLKLLHYLAVNHLNGAQSVAQLLEGLEELKKFHIDETTFTEMKSLVNYAGSLAGGTIVGTAGGALVAFGAYGAAQALAVASTGTAIASLSGVAATNATLAFFGGGSLAAGGLGLAGGTAVLGGLVAGPALMVMGLVTGHAAKKDLEKAYTNKAEAIQIASQLQVAGLQCETIRRRTYMFYNLLARLDTYFLPLIYKMEEIVENEGTDYRIYGMDSKKVIASCASVAVSVKTVLDTPLLTDDGLLTEESEGTVSSIEGILTSMKKDK